MACRARVSVQLASARRSRSHTVDEVIVGLVDAGAALHGDARPRAPDHRHLRRLALRAVEWRVALGGPGRVEARERRRFQQLRHVCRSLLTPTHIQVSSKARGAHKRLTPTLGQNDVVAVKSKREKARAERAMPHLLEGVRAVDARQEDRAVEQKLPPGTLQFQRLNTPEQCARSSAPRHRMAIGTTTLEFPGAGEAVA